MSEGASDSMGVAGPGVPSSQNSDSFENEPVLDLRSMGGWGPDPLLPPNPGKVSPLPPRDASSRGERGSLESRGLWSGVTTIVAMSLK